MRNLPADHQFVQWGTIATCLRVCLAAPQLNPIGGALLPLLPGRATGAAAAAAGHQPPPPGRSASGPRATRSPPASPTAARLGRSPQRQRTRIQIEMTDLVGSWKTRGEANERLPEM
jgi:hypothetical protein